MRRAGLAVCLLLTLFFIARFNFTEENINAHFISVVPGVWTDDQSTTHRASEGNPKSVTVRNVLPRNTEKVSINDSRHEALTGLEAEPVPGERHIIFLETVCVLNDSVRGKEPGLAVTQ